MLTNIITRRTILMRCLSYRVTQRYYAGIPTTSCTRSSNVIDKTFVNSHSVKAFSTGGKKTNSNGLRFEAFTDLSTEYSIVQKNTYGSYIVFDDMSQTACPLNEYEWVTTHKTKLFQFMNEHDHVDKSISRAHGCKLPDECFINRHTKTVFIIEKKFQNNNGSVCEKIQTPDFKLWQYRRTFPDFHVVYIYVLSDWFKDNCIPELEYLEYKNIPVFWGYCPNCKKDLVEFITNYKPKSQLSLNPGSLN